MKRILTSLTLVFPLAALAGSPAPSRIQQIAGEIRQEIADVQQALGEQRVDNPNGAEICFRVGNLYMSARHQLEESRGNGRLTTAQAQFVDQLIEDAKSLTSFCGDREKVAADPGYEQVPFADSPALKKELANMDRRAAGVLAGK